MRRRRPLLAAVLVGVCVTASQAAVDWRAMSAQLEAGDRDCAKGACDYAAATALVERLLREPANAGETASLTQTRAEILRRRGRLADAVTAARASLAIDPGHQRAQYTLGEALLGLGRPAEAAAAFDRAAASPRDRDFGRAAACRAARLQLERGQVDQAMALLPEPLPPHAWLGACLHSLAVLADTRKHLALAAEAYLRAAKTLGSDAEPWLRAMYLFASLGERDKAGAAVAGFTQRALVVPAGYETMFLYALTSSASPSAALQTLRAWHRREPSSLWIRELLATHCASHGLHAEAEGHYRALLAAGGERKSAYLNGLLGLLTTAQKMDDAAALCEAHAPSVAASVNNQYHCASAWLVRGDCRRALPLFRDVLAQADAATLRPPAALGTGLCLEAAGDLRGALAAYGLAPDDPAIAPRVRIVTRRLEGR